MDLTEIFGQGGYTMIAIVIASLAAVTEIVYCAFALTRRNVLPARLVAVAENISEETAEENLRLCRESRSPFGAVLGAAIDSRDLSREDAENLVEAAGRQAAHVLSRGVLVLEVVAAIAPLLGLLGTVVGMYEAFAHIAEAGVKSFGSLPEGISKALITTITGLIVAIPAYVFHSYFQRRVDELLLEMEHHALRLLSRLRNS